MKATFLTRDRRAACSDFYINAFKSNSSITLFDENFENYDVALFMTYDHAIVPHVKQKFPHLKIGIIDPRNHKVYDSTKHCDFLIVDSIEMEDYWRRSGIPIFRFVEYPNIPIVEKTHEEKEKITIGYHGNRIHLECMAEQVTPAISELGKEHDLEFLVIYNGGQPSPHEKWYPKNVNVKHVCWHPDVYTNYLAKCDIGLVPNNLVMNDVTKELSKTNSNFNYSPDDYSLRFKMPSNPGRFVIFGRLGIPVVADFYPSALQYIKGDTGFVANSAAGWKHCIGELIKSHSLRQKMGNSLQSLVQREFDFEYQNRELNHFLKGILK
jgi:glycosyltransferase involved in cell wall biosynthesis